MRKKELLKLSPLLVTPEIQKLAGEDKLTRQKSPYGNHEYVVKNYQRKMYLRCLVEKRILKVGIFLPDHIRTGSPLPAFEVYVSKKERRFLTYDRMGNRWLEAKVDCIDFPDYMYHQGERWMKQEDSDKLRNYLGTVEGGYMGLLRYQRDIREAELVARHKKETDPWDKDLKQVPALPKDWLGWVQKTGVPEHFLYYHYKRGGAKTGYCTHCGHEVPIQKPRFNKKGKCPHCGHEVVFKSAGKAGMVWTGRYPAYLIQRCRDGFVIREFQVQCRYLRNGYREPEVFSHEVRRVIFDAQFQPRAYYWDVYKQRVSRWIAGFPMNLHWSGNANGMVYNRTLPYLAKHQLKKTGLIEWIWHYGKVDPERYLVAFSKIPQLEQITKAGLWQLAEECVKQRYDFQRNIRFYTASSLTGMLGIHPQGLKRLREANGGFLFLSWLQYEAISGKPLSDEIIGWFCTQEVSTRDLDFIMDRMSPLQVRNYLTRQMHAMKWNCRWVLNTWADYLSMAKRLRMNINDEIVYRVRKLKQRHDELVKICQERAPELRLMEMQEKYPKVDQVCKTLKKYEYRGKKYSILAPNGISDILAEGDALHHCVSTQERYWERIEQRESYILFLRKNTALKKPYYTLEVEPDGTVRQKRTEFDRHDKDIHMIEQFLTEWQVAVSSRMTEEDRSIAETSRVLRLEEFAELREKKAIIHTGDLAGKKLVDVLTADLMVNKAA